MSGCYCCTAMQCGRQKPAILISLMLNWRGTNYCHFCFNNCLKEEIQGTQVDEQEFWRWVERTWKREEEKRARKLSNDAIYLAGAAQAEAGEVFDVFKKPFRAGRYSLNAEEKARALEEIGDTYHYLTKLLQLLGHTWGEARFRNTKKLEERYRDA